MLRAALLALLVAAPAFGQEAEPSTPGGFFSGLAREILPHSPETPAADFVRQSRPTDMDYRPFDPTADRTDRRKTAEEMARVTRDLETAAAANRQKAARVKIPN